MVAGLTALRPVVRAAVVSWAWDNPSSLRVPFVADFIREDLGAALTERAGTDPAEVVFEVLPGDTPAVIAPRLEAGGFIDSRRAFVFTAIQQDLAPKLQAGLFVLRRDMTPVEVVGALIDARVVVTSST